MSVTTVKNAIAAALRPAATDTAGLPALTGTEVSAIADAALRPDKGEAVGKLTNQEAKEIGALYEKATGPQLMHAQPTFVLSGNAYDVFNARLTKPHNLPYGDNVEAVRTKMLAAIDKLELDGAGLPPLATAPATTDLHVVFLEDVRPVDGALREAYLDVETQSFFVKSSFLSRQTGAEVTTWAGPVSLDDAGSAATAKA